MTVTNKSSYLNDSNNTFNRAIGLLSTLPLAEIDALIDKINYYIEHINTLIASRYIYIDKTQLQLKYEVLDNIQKILLSELDRRTRR